MNQVLHNPVYHALLSGDQHLNIGNDEIKFFDEDISPFAGFADGYEKGFADLHDLLSPGRKILYAIPSLITSPPGWQIKHEIKGLQFVYDGGNNFNQDFSKVIPLFKQHIQQMVQLAKLTKPGPFGERTIEFGSYFGIFEDDTLVAMTGQRLHTKNYTEISAVCTHPNHTSKGYANILLQHQLQLILQKGQQPFLHVREDNERAITLYQRLGFILSRSMNFYFMQRS